MLLNPILQETVKINGHYNLSERFIVYKTYNRKDIVYKQRKYHGHYEVQIFEDKKSAEDKVKYLNSNKKRVLWKVGKASSFYTLIVDSCYLDNNDYFNQFKLTLIVNTSLQNIKSLGGVKAHNLTNTTALPIIDLEFSKKTALQKLVNAKKEYEDLVNKESEKLKRIEELKKIDINKELEEHLFCEDDRTVRLLYGRE